MPALKPNIRAIKPQHHPHLLHSKACQTTAPGLLASAVQSLPSACPPHLPQGHTTFPFLACTSFFKLLLTSLTDSVHILPPKFCRGIQIIKCSEEWNFKKNKRRISVALHSLLKTLLQDCFIPSGLMDKYLLDL